MTRQQYLTKLQNCLCFLLPDSEVSEILCDMEECFDAGINEGKTEEEICLSLGSPKDAAKEILSERHESANPFASQMGGKYISPLICIALGALVFFTVDFMTAGALAIVGIILPPLMHLILERNNFVGALKAEKTDIFALSAAILWFGAVLLFMPFVNVMLWADGSSAFGLSVDISALTIVPQIMLLISVFKSGKPKLFCIVPTFIIGMVVVSEFITSVDLSGFAASYFTARAYYSYSGAVCNVYSIIMIITAAELFLWEILNRSALSLPTQYLIVFGGIISKFIRWRLYITDPTDPYSISLNNGIITPIAVIGAAAFIVSFAAVITVRLKSQRKDGEV